MTYDAFCELALRLPGVEESTSYGTPSLKVGKGLLARLREDGIVVLKADPSERDALIESQPNAFFVTDHYAGYPYVLIRLENADAGQMEGLIERACRMAAPSLGRNGRSRAATGMSALPGGEIRFSEASPSFAGANEGEASE